MIIDPFPIIQKLDWVHSNFRSRWCSSLLCQAERVTDWAEWFKCRILKLSSVCRQHIHTYTDWTMKMTHSLQVWARAVPAFSLLCSWAVRSARARHIYFAPWFQVVFAWIAKRSDWFRPVSFRRAQWAGNNSCLFPLLVAVACSRYVEANHS